MTSKKLQLEYLIFSYIDDSGSFENVPKRGDEMDSPLGRIHIVKSDILTKYTDGGQKPFYVELKSRLVPSRIVKE